MIIHPLNPQKKHQLLKALAFSLCVLCCPLVNGQSGPEAGIVDRHYEYALDGNIGSFEVSMRYRISGDAVSGYYYYENYGTPIQIMGYIDQDSVVIYEFDERTNKTGAFKGIAGKDQAFLGDWINLKNGRMYPFELRGKVVPFKNYSGMVYLRDYRNLTFSDQSDSIILDPEGFRLIDHAGKFGDHYFLFRIGSLSKPGSNGMGMCGAGYEEKIVLLKTDENLQLKDETAYLINSCWYPYMTDEQGSPWENDMFILEGEIYETEAVTAFTITYDKNNPENGLKRECYAGNP